MSIKDGNARPKTLAMVAIAVAAGGALAACGGTSAGGGNTATSSDSVAVRAVDHPQLGRILVDAGGHTLYFADQESNGKLQCTGDCLKFWFPAKSRDERPVATDVDALDVLHRSDNGQSQLTYRGKPLYTFQLDKASGDANGNDVKDEFGGTHFTWHAVTLDKKTGDDSGGGGGGYSGGY
jgi:predicted lipoprotein with Yx(FWY)xxD motif